MNPDICIGIDFGSTGYRIAAFLDDKIRTIPSGAIGERHNALIGCRTLNNNYIEFPSTKKMIGSKESITTLYGVLNADDVTLAIFQEIKGILKSFVKDDVQLVIAVPAFFSESKRAVLLEIAKKAGFKNCMLVNDSILAAINYGLDSQKDNKIMVVGCGYAQSEIALMKRNKQQFEVLSYGLLGNICGQKINESITTGLIKAFLGANIDDNQKMIYVNDLLNNRLQVNHAIEQLNYLNTAYLRVLFNKIGLVSPLDRDMFNEYIQLLFNDSLPTFNNTFKEANIDKSEINSVLLAGGTTRMHVFQKLIADYFPNAKIYTMGDDAIARGAVAYGIKILYADDAKAKKAEKTSEDIFQSKTEFLSVDLIKTSTISNKNPFDKNNNKVGKPKNFSDTLNNLWEQISLMEPANAQTILKDIAKRAKKELDKFNTKNKENFWIEKAYESLKANDLERAVQHSHTAFKMDKDNVKVFEAMIDIHIKAAEKTRAANDIEKSLQMLNCAFGHDQSNIALMELMAEDFYALATIARQNNQLKKALDFLNECLRYNRGHTKARNMKKELLEHAKKT